MKKSCFLCLPAVLGALVLFGGCALYGNDRSRAEYVHSYEENGKIYFYNVTSMYVDDRDCLAFDPLSGTLAFASADPAETTCFADPAVLDGNTFPRGMLEADEDYEGLTEKLLALDGRETPYVQAYALKAADGSAYGFCNVYSSPTGMLSGGGQIDVKKVEKGILFTYSPLTDQLTVLEEFERGCVVAFNQTHYVYYFGRYYYAKEIGNADCVELCEDGAYDTGMTHYSHAEFYFNEEYCIVKFHRGYNNYKKDYDDFLLYRMNGEKLSELHVPSNFD